MEPIPLIINQPIIPIEETKETPDVFTVFPDELMLRIFFSLKTNYPECALVSRRWRRLIDDEANHPAEAFGRKEWIKFFGDPGPVPPLPRCVHKDLATGNYLLTLIPKTVNNQPLTIYSFEELAYKLLDSQPISGLSAISSQYSWKIFFDFYGKIANGASYWVLLQNKVIEGSIDKDSVTKQQLLSQSGHQLPELLWTIVSLVARFFSKGERLFTDETYIRVKETVPDTDDTPIETFVGDFSAEEGLEVVGECSANKIGVAGARKSISI